MEPSPAELNESAMNFFAKGGAENAIYAAKQLQWALIGNPSYAEAWHNRAQILRALNDPFDAELCVRKALDIEPHSAAYWNTLGVCRAVMHQFSDAVAHYSKALQINSELPEAHHNLAIALRAASDYGRAVFHARRAVELRPHDADAHVAYAGALLRNGELGDGFEEYKWRFKATSGFRRMMPLPEWDGGYPVGGVVLYAEQGYGDAIQFLRFAPQIKRKYPDMKVYVEVKKPLYALVETMRGIDGVIRYGEPVPDDATHCMALMSAPCAADVLDEDDLEDCAPYFHLPKAKFGNILPEQLSVGICWRTGVRPYQPELAEFADTKSIDPQFLQPLREIESVQWHNLQVPHQAIAGFAMADHELHDFFDTAQLIDGLDVVVSVDTSVAHLAGALGKPVILMTPFDNCWRWRGSQSHSVWYPSLTQYRQDAPGDWPSVIAAVKSRLEGFWPGDAA